MLFNALPFLLFFVLVLGLFQWIPSWNGKKTLLLAASYLFYGAWNPPFVLLLAFSTGVDWFAARAMGQTGPGGRRRALLAVSLVANLGLLGFFKYGGFLLENYEALLGAFGMHYAPPAWDIVLPVGISFYTFQTLSYTIDVYRGRLRPWTSFLDFALFVSFFPQLVAGPIVRAAEFLPQCTTERRTTAKGLGFGLFLMTVGLFQKIVLADGILSDAADAVFGSPGPVFALDAWFGVVAFAGQIFCDFAGYSTTAIGVALCFGFVLPDNFRFPYAAVGFRDFWRRWHISLSTWLRDYLYIPLGGSRLGRTRMAIALSATMLLGGLWHGASWNFVVWGGLHGVFLVAERGITLLVGPRPFARHPAVRTATGVLTFVLVCVAWVFFRAEDLPRSMMILATMAGAIDAAPVLPTLDMVLVGAVTGGLVLTHMALRNRSLEAFVRGMPWWLLTVLWCFMLGAIILMQGAGDAFLYFQF